MLIIVPYTSIYYDIISSLILWNIIIIIVNLLIHNHHVFGVNIFSLKIPAVPRRNSKSALAMEFLVALGVLHVHWSALWSFVIICACFIYIYMESFCMTLWFIWLFFVHFVGMRDDIIIVTTTRISRYQHILIDISCMKPSHLFECWDRSEIHKDPFFRNYGNTQKR